MSDEIIWLTIFDRISITASPFTLHLGGCGTGGALPPRPRPTFHLCLVLCVWVFVCTQGWWSSSHVHARHRLRQKAGVEGWQVGFRSKRIIAVVNKTGGWLTMPGWPVGRQRHAVASHTPRLPPANVDNWRIVQKKKTYCKNSKMHYGCFYLLRTENAPGARPRWRAVSWEERSLLTGRFWHEDATCGDRWSQRWVDGFAPLPAQCHAPETPRRARWARA